MGNGNAQYFFFAVSAFEQNAMCVVLPNDIHACARMTSRREIYIVIVVVHMIRFTAGAAQRF
jgi:hypothetical protein